jgi:hypothetical protein
MQNPTDQTEASIPTDTTSNNNDDGPDWNRIVKVRRKVAKRTRPFELAVEELDLVPSSAPHAEQKPPAKKRPRLEEPCFSASIDEAASKIASPDVSVDLPHPPAADGNANASIRATRQFWTLEEDAKLTSAVANTSKKKYGKECTTDWVAISALVPGRTRVQCRDRWNGVLDPNIDRAAGNEGRWTANEDSKLKDAVQSHGGKNWVAIAALVSTRTKTQCRNKWHGSDVSNIDPTTARAGRWTADEDKKLKDAVQTHGGKNWVAIAALVPSRTITQCRKRWHVTLKPKIDRASGPTGT